MRGAGNLNSIGRGNTERMVCNSLPSRDTLHTAPYQKRKSSMNDEGYKDVSASSFHFQAETEAAEDSQFEFLDD